MGSGCKCTVIRELGFPKWQNISYDSKRAWTCTQPPFVWEIRLVSQCKQDTCERQDLSIEPNSWFSNYQITWISWIQWKFSSFLSFAWIQGHVGIPRATIDCPQQVGDKREFKVWTLSWIFLLIWVDSLKAWKLHRCLYFFTIGWP